MASRSTVSQQPRGKEAGIVGGRQKNMTREGPNRRALYDIGNLVTLKAAGVKPSVQISRPVTRKSGAQFLVKQQAGSVIDNHVDPKEKSKNVVRTPTEKKVNQKKSEAVCVGSARRKKVPTTTSILTARSRAACGLVANKIPKDLIVDIDAADVDNELAVVEYVEDIFKFYKLTENEIQLHDYMNSQPELNEKMRGILVDWLIQVHNRFELMPETLYLAINVIDRFLCLKAVPRKELQLLGIGALLIACKYEEIWAPQVKEFVCISDNVYTNEQVLKVEKVILGKLEWNITVPTSYMFLARFIKAAISDSELENMAYFFAELALTSYTALVYCPSMVAASSVYVARRTLHKSPAWTETLKLHTKFTESQLMDCAKLLVTLHSTAADSKFQAVYKKYSKPERRVVALTVPEKSILTLSTDS